jgi:hypothetical protein
MLLGRVAAPKIKSRSHHSGAEGLIASESFLALQVLQQLHRINDQALGFLNLFHDEANVHSGILRLPLAPAIDAMLADEAKSIRKYVEGGGQAAADRAHLEFVSLFYFTIMIEQVESPSVDIR